MNITRTINRPAAAAAPKAPAAEAQAPKQEDAKPSAVDAFSSGAYSYADTANGLIGAYAGGTGLGLVGGVAGVAISAGGDIINAIGGAISGDSALTLEGVWNAGLKAGAFGIGGMVGGGLIGGTAGFFAGRGLSRGVGSIAGSITEKFGGNENVGRAVGSVAVGALMGAKGAGVMGYNAALITGGAAAVGGTIAFARN